MHKDCPRFCEHDVQVAPHQEPEKKIHKKVFCVFFFLNQIIYYILISVLHLFKVHNRSFFPHTKKSKERYQKTHTSLLEISNWFQRKKIKNCYFLFPIWLSYRLAKEDFYIIKTINYMRTGADSRKGVPGVRPP